MKDLFSRVHSLDPTARIEGDVLHTTAATLSQLVTCPHDHDHSVQVRGDVIVSDVRLGPAWRRDAGVWYLPLKPDPHVLCIIHGGKQHGDRTAYVFDRADDLIKAAAAIGYRITLPTSLLDRSGEIALTRHKNIVAKIAYHEEDKRCEHLSRWYVDRKHWCRVLGDVPQPSRSAHNLDDLVRCLETPSGREAGWAVRKVDGDWTFMSGSAARLVIQAALDIPRFEAEPIQGRLANSPWKLVQLPFAPEYPGRRRWNRGAAQWAFEPVPCENWRLECPHWRMILEHIGTDLNVALTTSGSPFVDGTGYLFHLLASINQKPTAPTPYLFLYGPQNGGKSILHEGYEILVTRGVVKADRALTSRSDFNGELENAILCVVEEKDIANAPGAYAKIKDAVTAVRLSIRRMRTDSYMVDNTTHWIQCANSQDACPVFETDTRIQPIYVGPLVKEIAKPVLLEHLRDEAPKFIYALQTATIPKAEGRLALPLVHTATRERLTARNMPDLIVGIADHVLTGKREKWKGTAADLCKAIGCDGPTDFRPASKLLEMHRKYLADRRIKVEFPAPSANNPRTVVLTRMRAA